MRLEMQTKLQKNGEGRQPEDTKDAMEQQISNSGVSLNPRAALLAPANADSLSFPRAVAHTGQFTVFVVWRCAGYPS